MLSCVKSCLDPCHVGLKSSRGGEQHSCIRLEIPSTRVCRALRAVESPLFLPANMHYPAAQCFLLSLCFKPLFMGFVVSGSALHAGVLPPNEELAFKYHKASLVCLPLRCEAECKLLKIGIDNVELEDKSSLRLSDVLREPVLSSCTWVSFACAQAVIQCSGFLPYGGI